MYKAVIEGKQLELSNAIEHYKSELNKIRTGRANPALVEDLMVDYYGSKTPLKQIASISAPEPRLIVIQPWSVDALINIETAIKASGLGFNPNNDGRIIRINIPPLTEDRRKELVKFLSKQTEEARIAIRNVREKIWREIQDLEESGSISEDDKFRGKDELQKMIDEYNGKIGELQEKKEKEIMTV